MSKNNELSHRIDDADNYSFDIYDAVPSRIKAVRIPVIPIDQALTTVYKQLLAMGRREVTVESYDYAFRMFIKVCDIKTVQDITANKLIHFLDHLKGLGHQPSTCNMRLKAIKAVLSRFFDNGWYHNKFWINVSVKFDKKVKPEAKLEDIAIVVNHIDKTTFVGFRNAAAIILMLKTGIRSATLERLRESHIDFDNTVLKISAEALKSREPIHLPVDQDTMMLLARLLEQNRLVRERNSTRNNYVFISERGTPLLTKSKNNAISKAISKYAKELNLKNVNPHSIRRTYAKNLLRQGANIAIISRALGHANLEVTTQYLGYELEELESNLRNFL